MQTEPPNSRDPDIQLLFYITLLTLRRVMITLRLGSKIGGENKLMR